MHFMNLEKEDIDKYFLLFTAYVKGYCRRNLSSIDTPRLSKVSLISAIHETVAQGMFPSVKELAKKFDVSATTIRKALSDLEKKNEQLAEISDLSFRYCFAGRGFETFTWIILKPDNAKDSPQDEMRIGDDLQNARESASKIKDDFLRTIAYVAIHMAKNFQVSS